MDKGGDINQVDKAGDTVLHIAWAKQNKKALKLILQQNPDQTISNKKGESFEILKLEHSWVTELERDIFRERWEVQRLKREKKMKKVEVNEDQKNNFSSKMLMLKEAMLQKLNRSKLEEEKVEIRKIYKTKLRLHRPNQRILNV